MNDQFQLPDGTIVGTGLQLPVMKTSAFPQFEKVMAPQILSRDDIIAAAKTGKYSGRRRFDPSFNRNQGSHGSCNGFAAARALTKSRVRRQKPRVELSGAYAYSLINGNRDNGSMLEDGLREIERTGIATEATVPWNKVFRSQYDRAKADAEAKQYKGFECYAVESEAGLLTAFALDFICIVAVHADNGFMRLDSNGIAQGGNGPGNHSVHCDGFEWDDNANTLKMDMDNSWGTSYGEQGRSFLTWERHFRSTFRYHMFYAIRDTSDADNDLQPPMGQPD